MAYATTGQFVDAYGLRELADLLRDEEALVSEDLLRDALAGDVTAWSQAEQDAVARALARATTAFARQSNFIDSHLMARYALPLLSPETTPVVECCLALTRAALAEDGDNISTTVKEERKHWRDWLKQVASGEAFLPGETAVGEGGADLKRHAGRMSSALDWEVYP